MRAPFSGVVAEVFVEKGEVAPPGAPIARLVKLDPAVVSVSVSDRDVGALTQGAKARVRAAGRGGDVAGTITSIHPAADEKTRAFTVEVSVPNPDGTLRPGMIAAVEFQEQGEEERLVIPQDFLVTRLDDTGVFVADDKNVARWRELELGQILGRNVVIDGGLDAGARVVIVGQRTLQDGDALLIAREGRCCTEGRVTHGDSEQARP